MGVERRAKWRNGLRRNDENNGLHRNDENNDLHRNDENNDLHTVNDVKIWWDDTNDVAPANAGAQRNREIWRNSGGCFDPWIPAFAGMTSWGGFRRDDDLESLSPE
jgi:hypothetical protein